MAQVGEARDVPSRYGPGSLRAVVPIPMAEKTYHRGGEAHGTEKNGRPGKTPGTNKKFSGTEKNGLRDTFCAR